MKPGRHALSVTSSVDGSTQPNNLFVPSAHECGEPLPLVIVLHGITATWETWFDVTDVCQWAEREGYLVLAPHGRGDWFYLGPGYHDVFDAIAEVQRVCHVDAERLSLMGHSMGGWGAWHFACTRPQMFAAIVPMSCWAPLELLSNLIATPVLAIHGGSDDVVSPRHLRHAEAELMVHGCPHETITLTGVDHSSKMISDMLPRIGDSLRDRRRQPPPHALRARANVSTRGRIHWIRILKTGHFPNVATVEGRIEGMHLQLRTDSVREFAVIPADFPPGAEVSRVTLDHHDFNFPTLPTGRAVRFKRVHRSWMSREADVADLERMAPAVVGHQTKHIDDLPSRLAAIIGEHFDADLTLLPRVFVAPLVPQGEISAEQLIDLWLHPNNTLHDADVAHADLNRALAAIERDMPAFWGGLAVHRRERQAGMMRLVVPSLLVGPLRRAKHSVGVLDVGLREAIHLHLQAHGSLELQS